MIPPEDSSPQLPLSTALSEAQPESIQELLSRDPEGYQRQDPARVIQLIRENRERLASANVAGKRVTHQKVKELPSPTETAEDLGF